MNYISISPMSLEVQLYLANSNKKEYAIWRRYEKVMKKKAIND